MNPLLLDILPLLREKYCCSQILILMALHARGEENSGLIRALWGLCEGMAQGGQSCGLLSGGVCLLSYLAGRSGPNDEAHPMALPLINGYVTWFVSRTAPCGGTSCPQVAAWLGTSAGRPEPESGAPDMELCGELLAECWEKLLELLAVYDIDISNARME